MAATLKESDKKESLGWQYKELEFDFEEQISMFKEDKNEHIYRKSS